MAKLGFVLPDELERRLRRFIPWGKKQQIIEGLLRVVAGELEEGVDTLYERAVKAYWREHDRE